MPRNASTGVYTPPANSWNPATPDTVISSADWNALRDDMATALNHAPSTTRALYPTTGQVQDGAFIWGGTAGGTADALTLTLTPAITAYTPGLTIRFRTGLTPNTTATPTLSVNGLAAHTITRYDGGPLVAGDLPANAVVEVLHDGTGWRLLLTVQSQIQGNDSATTVTSATSLVLTNASTRVQVVSMTADGQSVFLPNAKNLTTGGPRFYIRNAGLKTFALRSSNENQLANGGFDNNSAWTLGTGWEISGGVATKTPGSATDIEQTLSTDGGVAYLITYTITSISGGTVQAVLKGGGPDVLGTPRNAPGTYTETLISTANTTVAIRADANFNGSIDNISLTVRYPPLLAGMPQGAVAECVLENNSTIQGRWHVIGRNTSVVVPIVNAMMPSSLNITTPGIRTLKMNEDITLHFAQNVSGHPFVVAVNHGAVPPEIGTPVLISAVNASVKQAFRINDNKAFIVIDSSSNNCFNIAISGTSCTVSSAVTAGVFQEGKHWDRPLCAVLGTNNDRFVAIDKNSSNIRAQAVDASSATPAAGSDVTVSSIGGRVAVSVFRVDDNRAIAFYVDNSGVAGEPFSIRGAVLTLTGTSINVGTSAGINDVINDINYAYGMVCQISNTEYVWVYGSGSNVMAVAINVSESSVTFGTPITVTTFPSGVNVLYSLGNRFNPVIYALSGNRVFVAFRGGSPSYFCCVILTINGLSVSAGPVLSINNVNELTLSRYNNEHTVLFQNSVWHEGHTGSAIGLDHTSTSIIPSGSVTLMGLPRGAAASAKMPNGLICMQYVTVGRVTPNVLFSSRIEVLAPSPNGSPISLGHFTIPEVDLGDIVWMQEVSRRRVAFLARAALQEGTNGGVKLCIMEVVSWPH